jgi:hypothetical protein
MELGREDRDGRLGDQERGEARGLDLDVTAP